MTNLICLALLALPTQASIRVPIGDTPAVQGGGLISGFFLMEWDDAVDGKVVVGDHRCVIDVRVKEDKAFGKFYSLPGSSDRQANLDGRFDRGLREVSVLSFRQIEHNYICSYQMTVGSGQLVGVWHDSEGRSGDFRLRSAQDLLRSGLAPAPADHRG